MFGDEMNYRKVAGNAGHKVLFEDHQEQVSQKAALCIRVRNNTNSIRLLNFLQLEICTERLNKMIIMPVEDVKPSTLQDLMNLTGIADRRTKGTSSLCTSTEMN